MSTKAIRPLITPGFGRSIFRIAVAVPGHAFDFDMRLCLKSSNTWNIRKIFSKTYGYRRFLRIPTNTISYDTRLNAFDKNRIYRMFLVENNTISVLLNRVKFLAILYDQIRHFKSFDLNSLKKTLPMLMCLRINFFFYVLLETGIWCCDFSNVTGIWYETHLDFVCRTIRM